LWDAISSATAMPPTNQIIRVGMCGNAVPDLRGSRARGRPSLLVMLIILSPSNGAFTRAQRRVLLDPGTGSCPITTAISHRLVKPDVSCVTLGKMFPNNLSEQP
jgi:hypothetical protein